MSRRTRFHADLEFSITLPGENEQGLGPTWSGTLRGQDSDLELFVDDLTLLAGQFVRRREVAALGSALAERNARLTVVDRTGPLFAVGDGRASLLQRLFTGSEHVRLFRVRAGTAWLRARRRARARHVPSVRPPTSPPAPSLPPATVLPLAPTFAHPRRRPATTTHDAPGSGDPRLIFALGPKPRPGDQQRIFYLRAGVTTIGSDPSTDLCLDGLEPHHAEIRRDQNDEYVLVRAVERTVLRTGTRIELGQWRMSYFREEYADHGRPYGGRPGGELGHQRPQPPRQRTGDSSVSPPTDARGRPEH